MLWLDHQKVLMRCEQQDLPFNITMEVIGAEIWVFLLKFESLLDVLNKLIWSHRFVVYRCSLFGWDQLVGHHEPTRPHTPKAAQIMNIFLQVLVTGKYGFWTVCRGLRGADRLTGHCSWPWPIIIASGATGSSSQIIDFDLLSISGPRLFVSIWQSCPPLTMNMIYTRPSSVAAHNS